MSVRRKSLPLLTLAVTFSVSLSAIGDQPKNFRADSLGSSKTTHGWTAQDFQNATPRQSFSNAEVVNRDIYFREDVAHQDNPAESRFVAPQEPDPSVEIAPVKIYEPLPADEPEKPSSDSDEAGIDGGVTHRDKGSSGIPYSSARLRLPKFYPNSTIGKLFYKDGDGSAYSCSGSVIGKRIVLTAGHCIHNGNGQPSGWFQDFVFLPSFKYGEARNGVWYGDDAWVTGNWYSNGGDASTPNDFGFVIISDKNISEQVVSLSDVTGSLSWRTFRLGNNHVHAAGYPANLDNGEFPIQVASQTQHVTGDYWAFGNDMEHGSSGSAVIQNFGSLPQGRAGTPNWFGIPNSVVGVLHGGPTDNSGPRLGTASQLNNVFVNLWDSACAAGDGKNCQ